LTKEATLSAPNENSISVLGRELLLVDVGGGAETHLARESDGDGRSADHPGDADIEHGRWEVTTMCGRTWDRMAAGADELLPLWADPAFAPTCRACLRILDTWFPAADVPPGVHLLAAVVAEDVTRFSSAYVTGIPAECVEGARSVIRKTLRSAGFRSNTMVVEGVVQVWSDDAYQAIDPAAIRARVVGAIDKAIGAESPDAQEEPAGPGPIDWHTWVIES
jgi:hypothetical protein